MHWALQLAVTVWAWPAHARRVDPGTPLSVVWHVESLLASLRSTGNTCFSVVWFSDYISAWQEAGAAHAALRFIVQRHLQASGVPCLEFSCFWSPDFASALKTAQPVVSLGYIYCFPH